MRRSRPLHQLQHAHVAAIRRQVHNARAVGHGAAAQQAGIDVKDIDWFVPHQANQRILSAVGERLGLEEQRLAEACGAPLDTLPRYGLACYAATCPCSIF